MEFKEAKRLTVGKVYSDLDEHDDYTTYLKLIKSDRGGFYFEYVAGEKTYKGVNGLIFFARPIRFYKPTEAQLKEILKS
jgi:hypothetical protein